MSASRSLFSAALLAATCLLPAHAWGGVNSNGTFIVHADASIGYTRGNDYCDRDFHGPPSCLTATTRVDTNGSDAVMIWFIAAFPDNTFPSLTTVDFGIDSSVPRNDVIGYGACGNEMAQLPSTDYPGPGSSDIIYADARHDTMIPISWYAVIGTIGDYFGTGPNPNTGRAKFVDDSDPPIEDVITRFGRVGFGVNGANQCPPGTKPASWGQLKSGYHN